MIRKSIAMFFVLMLAAQVFATSVIPMTVEQLSISANRVVRVKAISNESRWTADHRQIYTFTTFNVLETLKGTAPQQIVVRQMGGRVGGVIQKVSGVRHFQQGEESVLFLRDSEVGSGVQAVVGLFQGDFSVKRSPIAEPTVSNGVDEVMQYDPQRRSIGAFKAQTITLNELRQRVTKTVAQ